MFYLLKSFLLTTCRIIPFLRNQRLLRLHFRWQQSTNTFLNLLQLIIRRIWVTSRNFIKQLINLLCNVLLLILRNTLLHTNLWNIFTLLLKRVLNTNFVLLNITKLLLHVYTNLLIINNTLLHSNLRNTNLFLRIINLLLLYNTGNIIILLILLNLQSIIRSILNIQTTHLFRHKYSLNTTILLNHILLKLLSNLTMHRSNITQRLQHITPIRKPLLITNILLTTNNTRNLLNLLLLLYNSRQLLRKSII